MQDNIKRGSLTLTPLGDLPLSDSPPRDPFFLIKIKNIIYFNRLGGTPMLSRWKRGVGGESCDHLR